MVCSNQGGLHHSSATEGNKQHEQPVGNEAESPHHVAKGNRKAKLSDLAIEGMEPTFDELELLLAARLLQGDKLVGGGRGHVESFLVDVDGGRGREHLEDIEG